MLLPSFLGGVSRTLPIFLTCFARPPPPTFLPRSQKCLNSLGTFSTGIWDSKAPVNAALPPSASASSPSLRRIEFVPTTSIEEYFSSIGLEDARAKELIEGLRTRDVLESIKAIDADKLKPPRKVRGCEGACAVERY